jgi:hypothetical protein
VKIGYSRPGTIRGLHPSGFREVMVWRVKDLENVDPKTQVARIAHTVGENKRVLILEEAKKTNIRVLNPGLKKPTEVVPEVVPEPTPTEPTPETEEETMAPSEKKDEAKGKSKSRKRRKSSK